MSEPSQYQSCIRGCRAVVPDELQTERLCVAHFLSSVEKVCAEMRRETAAAYASATRQTEIANYVVTSGVRLAQVATGSARLSDPMKSRILTTFLTLMNLRESMDRAASRFAPERQAPRSGDALASAAVPS
jgi:hypothetical protein